MYKTYSIKYLLNIYRYLYQYSSASAQRRKVERFRRQRVAVQDIPTHQMGGTKSATSAISKQLKSKGLQKLRWYCQLCEKQCRDENGFKCHCASESHLRRVQLFGSNSKRAVDEYSTIFEQTFIKTLQLS